MTEKVLNFIHLIMKGSSHTSIKKMQLLRGERYPLHTYCHGTENLEYFEVLELSTEMKCPFVLRKGSPYNRQLR